MMIKEKKYYDIICYPLIIFLLLSGTTILLLFFRTQHNVPTNKDFNIYNKLILLLCQVVFVIFWISIMSIICVRQYNYHLYVLLVALVFFGISILCLITYFIDNLTIKF